MKTNNLIKTICLAGLFAVAGSASAQNTAPQNNKVIKIKIIDDKNGTKTVIDTTIIAGGSTGTDSLDVMIAAELDNIENEVGGKGEKVIIKKICIIDSAGCTGAKMKHDGKGMNDADLEKLMQELNADPKNPNSKKLIILDEKELPEGTVVTKEVKKNGSQAQVRVIIKSAGIKILSDDDKKLLANEGSFDDKLNLQKIDFYPNPGNGRFNLKFNLEQKGNTEVVIYNAEGKKAYYEMLQDFSGDYNKEIDISNNSKGIYFLKVTQGKNSSIRKIILE